MQIGGFLMFGLGFGAGWVFFEKPEWARAQLQRLAAWIRETF